MTELVDSILDLKAQCTRCGIWTSGRLHFDSRLKVVDSDGGLLFTNGWTCHNCLGEPWSSTDVVINP